MRPATCSLIAAAIYLGVFGGNCPVLAVQDSPINAGCYISAPGKCNIHLDPFTIYVNKGSRLKSFQLKANRKNIYHFVTDTSNPPLGSYTPSAPRLDFAVQCGKDYFVYLLAQDSGDADFQTIGSTSQITCPDGTGWLVWIPEATTAGAAMKAPGSIVMEGVVNAQGGDTVVRFEFGKTDAYGSEITATPSGFGDTVDHQVSATATGLDMNATYHYRVIAENSAGVAYGKDQTVKTYLNLVPIYYLLLLK